MQEALTEFLALNGNSLINIFQFGNVFSGLSSKERSSNQLFASDRHPMAKASLFKQNLLTIYLQVSSFNTRC